MKQTAWRTLRDRGVALLIITAITGIPALAGTTDNLVGIPLNKKIPVVLGDDLGFGKKYRPSMPDNFQPWGAQKVARKDGFPVRLGDYSIQFETREGVCGWDGKYWSDCKKGRNRHELSSEIYGWDPWNNDRWYALSLYVPEDFRVAKSMGTSIFQFWSGGKDSWHFKYRDDRGLYMRFEQHEMDKTFFAPTEAKGRWHDYILHVRHSMKDDGTMQVWADGKLAYDYKGRTALGDRRSKKPYFKFGIYNTAMGADGAPIDGGGFGNGKGMPDLVLYFDEIRTGATCTSLKLADLGYDCAGLID